MGWVLNGYFCRLECETRDDNERLVLCSGEHYTIQLLHSRKFNRLFGYYRTGITLLCKILYSLYKVI